MLENIDYVRQLFVHKYCVVVRSFTLIKLDVLQNIVHQVLRRLGVVLCKFQNEGSSSNLSRPLLIAL